jgi:hypothetical protein
MEGHIVTCLSLAFKHVFSAEDPPAGASSPKNGAGTSVAFLRAADGRPSYAGRERHRLVLDAGTGDAMERIRIEQHSFGGLLWVAGWLYSIGFLHMTFWIGVKALFVWPYYLGLFYSAAGK